MAIQSEIKKLYDCRLLENQFMCEAFDIGLENLANCTDEKMIKDVCIVFDDETEEEEIMFGLIHLIESFERDTYLTEMPKALPNMMGNAKEWAMRLNKRILNSEPDRIAYATKLMHMDEDIKSTVTHLLNEIIADNPQRFESAANEILNILKRHHARVNKISLLKRKNRRRNLMKELLHIVTISDESFLDIEANDLFCKKVFEKLAMIDPTLTLNGVNDKENISASIKLLKGTIAKSDSSIIVGRIFFFSETEIEAIEIKISEIHRELEKIVDMIKFTAGDGDFILVTDDLRFGICIERTEYQYEFYRWSV